MNYCRVCKGKYEDGIGYCPADGAELVCGHDQLIGRLFDGMFDIEELLGRGGMGTVYLARHRLIEDQVAIKILPPEMRQDPQRLQRFQREAQALRRFRHPNAVVVHDLRKADDGTIYMVMDYVEGQTLAAEVASHGPFSAADAFQILEPIIDALAAAHAAGVIHRDVKNDNIMIGKSIPGGEPFVKLLDFGIAKLLEVVGLAIGDKSVITGPDQLLGTPPYMSPEQRGAPQRDGSLEIDIRTDIYSLALALCELISGRQRLGPVGPNAHNFVIELLPNVPHSFREAIARALARDRDDRQSSMHEFAEQLRTGLGLSQPSSRRSVPREPTRNGQRFFAETEKHFEQANMDQPNNILPQQENGGNPDPLKTNAASSQESETTSNGELVRKRKPNKREGAHFDVLLQIDKLFYPLRFLRENLRTSPVEEMLKPFQSLLEPEVCKGTPKWISLGWMDDKLVLQAYPKPIHRGPAGQIKQDEEVVLGAAQQSVAFEYWPDGNSAGRKFIVELHKGSPVQLKFYDKDDPNAAILELDLSDDENVFSAVHLLKRRPARTRLQDVLESRRSLRYRLGGTSK